MELTASAAPDLAFTVAALEAAHLVEAIPAVEPDLCPAAAECSAVQRM